MTTAELGLGAATPIDGPSPEREPLANAEATTLTRNERLDRLPFNKAHRKLLMASGIGWAFDAMDVGLVSFVVTAIAADPHFNLDATQKSWVLSIGFIGMAIGAALFAAAGSLTSGLHWVDDSRTWGNILGLAIPATAVSNIALVKAIKAIGPTLTSILGAMEPLTAVLIGVLHFGEPFTAAGIAGVVLSVAAVTIVVTQGGKPAGNA